MSSSPSPANPEPTRAALDASRGQLLVEFGAGWCPICQAAQFLIAQTVRRYPAVTHIKIEDGKCRLLGRTYGVKLWPTLILLRDGLEVSRVVRPTTDAGIDAVLRALA